MEEIYDQQRRGLAQEYNHKKDRYRIYKLIFNLLFWISFIVFNLGEKIYYNFASELAYFDLRLIVFIVIIYLFYSLVDWTLSYFLFYGKIYGSIQVFYNLYYFIITLQLDILFAV